MQKLSGLDAMFLYLETQKTPMHIAGLSVCQPPEGYDGDAYEDFKAQIASRLHEIPAFHRILRPTPFEIDHPVWINADEVDMDYHIQRAHLPKPGRLEQLRLLIQRLHSQVLDRSRPLWQFHIIEGLEDEDFNLKPGTFALYTKSHHACVDGGAGISVMDIISDREPTPRPPLPKSQIRLSSQEPGFFEMLGSAYGRMLQQQVDLVAALPKISSAFSNVVRSFGGENSWSLKDLAPAPKTRFNTRIEQQRAYGAQTLSLPEVIAVAKAAGATINDVVLSICGGALRLYLARHNELPEKSLIAGVPVSLRELGDTSTNNQVAGILCAIGTDIDDPVERLKAVQAAAKRGKAQIGSVREVIPQDYNIFGAPAVLTIMSQLADRTSLIERMPAFLNVAISNVPGPRRPMYFAGSKVVGYFPVSIAAHGCALNITLHSYVDRLDFGLMACKKTVPDVQDIADDIVGEFRRLQAAVEGATAAKGAAATKKKAASPNGKTKAPRKAPAKRKPRTTKTTRGNGQTTQPGG